MNLEKTPLNWYSRQIPLKRSARKTGDRLGIKPRLPLFFRTFPAHKTVGGDKGVGVYTNHT